MSFANRLQYYRRIFSAYLVPGRSQLTFWHETPQANPNATTDKLGEYYMGFEAKADYSGHYDSHGIPMLDYHGQIGLQYNPIAIAQWGLGNHDLFHRTGSDERKEKFLKASDWLCNHLEQNRCGVWIWNHHFDWEYRDTLKAPWYSGLAQGQGISLLVRAHRETAKPEYFHAAERAFTSFLMPTEDGGVTFTDEHGNLWFEEYIVSPPTHILNGFMWAAWGVYDYFLATGDPTAQAPFPPGGADSAGKSGALRFGILVSLRAIRNAAEDGGQPLLSSVAHRAVTGHAPADRGKPICALCRSLGELRPQPRKTDSRFVLQECFQALLLLMYMKILYVSQYFPPEMGAPAARVAELAHYWVEDGHEVTVLTGFPNHPTGVVSAEYRSKFRRLVMREDVGGVNVVRTWLFPFPNRKAYERMLNYSSFCASASTTGMFVSRPDVLIATSPQLLVGLSGWWLARTKRVPFVFEVRDLWPESLAAVGMGNPDSMLNRSLGSVAGFLYKRSEHIVVVTPAFQEYLIQNWRVPPEKISVVENGVESDLFSPKSEQC